MNSYENPEPKPMPRSASLRKIPKWFRSKPSVLFSRLGIAEGPLPAFPGTDQAVEAGRLCRGLPLRGQHPARLRVDAHQQIRGKDPGDYREGDRVELLIADRTDLGFSAIIEDRHSGVLYANEVFRPLSIGQRVEGFIKRIRPDGKIDSCARAIGTSRGGESRGSHSRKTKRPRWFLDRARRLPGGRDLRSSGHQQKEVQDGGWRPLQKRRHRDRAGRYPSSELDLPRADNPCYDRLLS